MSEIKDKRNETFREYLTRRLLPYKPKAAKHLIPWDENRGGGTYRNKNEHKRQQRAARKIDRLAHIAYERRNGNESHVPKLKRVPAHIFE
jgi:hypothetical protein